MTGIEMATSKIISGCGFLPEPDQKGLFQTMVFLQAMFGPDRKRGPNEEIGLRQIEEGFMLLFKHLATGVFTKDGIKKKIALVWQAARKLHPEFVRKFEGVING